MKLLFTIVLQILFVPIFAQDLAIKNREFTFSIGASDYNVEKLPDNENLDFINYAYSEPEYLDFITVKLGYKFDFLSNWSADLKLMVMDDLAPDNYDVSAHYHLNKLIGIGAGSMLTNTYISYFEAYQLQTLPDYYLSDLNLRQFKTYDLGFYVSPMFKFIQSQWFRAMVKCDVGLSSFLKEATSFHHKRKFSNERLRYDYDTKMTFNPYLNPKAELRLQVFKIKSASVGLLLNANLFYAKRNINYNRTIQQWTSDNREAEIIKSPKHHYSRFEIDFGLYGRW